MKEFIIITSAIGAFQGFFFSMILFTRANNKSANKILAILLISLSFPLLHRYIILSQHFLAAYFLGFLLPLTIFLNGPLMYLYTRSMIKSIPIKKSFYLIHFLPPAIFFVIHFFGHFKALFLGIPLDEIIQKFPRSLKMVEARINENWMLYFFTLFLGSFSVISYTVISIGKIQAYTKRIKNYYSDIERISLWWLRTLLILFVLLFLILNTFHFLRFMNIISFKLFIIPGILVFIIVLIASYLAITQQDLLRVQPENFEKEQEGLPQLNEPERNEKNEEEKPPKYEKHSLTEEQSLEYLKEIEKFMENEKPYLEDSLTIKDLADQINIPSHHLSIAINRHRRQNFYSFINEYRVKEFQSQLKNAEEDKVSLLSLAYSSGFNSKSTFNQIFKKMVGLTPSEYRSNLIRES